MLNHKVNLIERAFKDKVITKAVKDKFLIHRKHHTLNHLLDMLNHIKKGKTFKESHILALKKEVRKKKNSSII